MTKPSSRRPTWILTVAAAYAVISGCGDDEPSHADRSSDGGLDATVASGSDATVSGFLDAGIVVRPPQPCVIVSDAGLVLRYPDAGSSTAAPPARDGFIGFAVAPCREDPVDASTKPVDAGPFTVGLIARSVEDP